MATTPRCVTKYELCILLLLYFSSSLIGIKIPCQRRIQMHIRLYPLHKLMKVYNYFVKSISINEVIGGSYDTNLAIGLRAVRRSDVASDSHVEAITRPNMSAVRWWWRPADRCCHTALRQIFTWTMAFVGADNGKRTPNVPIIELLCESPDERRLYNIDVTDVWWRQRKYCLSNDEVSYYMVRY